MNKTGKIALVGVGVAVVGGIIYYVVSKQNKTVVLAPYSPGAASGSASNAGQNSGQNILNTGQNVLNTVQSAVQTASQYLPTNASAQPLNQLSSYPTKAQLLAAIDTMGDGHGGMMDAGNKANYKNAINASYNPTTGHFQLGAWAIDVISNNPITLRNKNGSQVINTASSYYVDAPTAVFGIGRLR